MMSGNGAGHRKSNFNWFAIGIYIFHAQSKQLLSVIIRSGLIVALGTDCKGFNYTCNKLLDSYIRCVSSLPFNKFWGKTVTNTF